jgi:hypothetical protein
MLFPPQLGIKSHAKIFSCVGIWNFCVIDENWLLFNLVVCEVNMYRFGLVEFIRHFLVQIVTLLTADCSFLVEISTVSPITMTAVSSANVAMVLFDVVGTSLI